jgi:signal transduction histidine kinase/CheY-like chemotaxis protein
MPSKSRGPLRLVSTLVLVSLVAGSVLLSLAVRSGVRSEQRKLLAERTTEAGLLVGSLFSGIGQNLSTLEIIARPGVGSTDEFISSAQPLLGAASTIGVLQLAGADVSVLASVGAGPLTGAVVTGAQAALARRAVTAKGLVSAVFDEGHGRQLTFALASTNGLVLYETLSFDLSKPYTAAGTGPFSDLVGALYASTAPEPGSLVLSTTARLPLSGNVVRQAVTVGADQWVIVTKATEPLVGSLVANSPWGVLGAGLLAAALVTVLIETLARRRRYALALVDERTLELRDALKEQARLEQGEREARQIAEAANRSKSEFLSRMSHELRTPLNAVLGFGQLLELDELEESQQEAVAQIVKGGRHLLGLINDVLDISRIDTGNLSISLEPVAVRDLVDETVTLMAPLASARDVEVVNAVAGPHEDAHVLADRQRLKQVLLNLVSNAVKYNRLGGTVTLSCEPQQGRELRIVVTDTGPGIRPEDLDRLFIPFERLGAERSDVEGTGVGLALSRRLAEAMGGTVDLTSTLGTGSQFWVQVPVAEGPLERYERLGRHDDAAPKASTVAAEHRHKVLYIEDNSSNVRLVERILDRRSDVELITAMQGRLGLALAREHQPVLVLLDLHLPDLDGDQILRQLRADPSTAHIPVVILTADATAGQLERLLADGANAYLTKPLDVQELLTIVNNSIESASLPQA